MLEPFAAVHRHYYPLLTCILRAVFCYWLWGCSELPLWSYCVSLWVLFVLCGWILCQWSKGCSPVSVVCGRDTTGLRKRVTRMGELYTGYTISELYSSENSRSQWPRGLRRRSAAARLLRLWIRMPPGVWMSVCCECCVLSGRGLCDGLITCPEDSYRLWCGDLETS